jgi:CRP-like cAMP-binding protein
VYVSFSPLKTLSMSKQVLPVRNKPVSSVEDLIAYLFSFLRSSPDGLEEHLKKIIGTIKVKKMDYLLKEGAIANHIYFIKKGILRCFYKKKNDIEVTAWVFQEPNVVVAVNSFYKREKSFENIQAMVDTEAFYISYDQLEELYLKYPAFERVGRLLTIEYLMFFLMQLFGLRMHTSAERFDLWYKDNSDLLLYVQQKFLASNLDMLPETFSRMKNRRNVVKKKRE